MYSEKISLRDVITNLNFKKSKNKKRNIRAIIFA